MLVLVKSGPSSSFQPAIRSMFLANRPGRSSLDGASGIKVDRGEDAEAKGRVHGELFRNGGLEQRLKWQSAEKTSSAVELLVGEVQWTSFVNVAVCCSVTLLHVSPGVIPPDCMIALLNETRCLPP